MYAYANCSLVAFHNGARMVLEVDDVWDADDPFVLARPDLFSAAPLRVNRTVPARPQVEQATAAPGERRGGRGR